MKVAFVCNNSPSAIATWSGIPFHILRQLQHRHTVDVIATPFLDFLMSKASGFFRRFGIDPRLSPAYAALCGLLLDRRLQRVKPDLVIEVAASAKVARLSAKWPLLHISDSTFAAMTHYYPDVASLSGKTRKNGNVIESMVLRNAAMVMLPSEWARGSAIHHYAINPKKLYAIPFGANLAPSNGSEVVSHDHSKIRLLFVGVNWGRKGGDIALETLQILQQRGLDAELHVVGSRPQNAQSMPGLFLHGTLRKDNALERGLLEQLFATSSFFILPSRQEAYGIVFAEAAAFGLPVLATRTGGIPSVVRDGANGKLFDLADRAEAYADCIENIWADKRAYHEMRAQARKLYDDELSWEVWGARVEKIIAKSGQR